MDSMVSSNQMTALEALQQRTWLLHWSLFVYWNDSAKGGLEQLVDPGVCVWLLIFLLVDCAWRRRGISFSTSSSSYSPLLLAVLSDLRF